jgi:hypothetical protein
MLRLDLLSGAYFNNFNGTQALRIAQSKGSTRLGASLPQNGNRTGFRESHVSLNNQIDIVPKKKTLSVNFTHVLFSLLFTHDDLVMKAFVWLHCCTPACRSLEEAFRTELVSHTYLFLDFTCLFLLSLL